MPASDLGWDVTEFRLLGPVEVWADARLVNAGPPRQRSVLAALLVDAGRPVPRESLIDRVWGEEPPEGVRHALHTHIARLRRVLAEATGGAAVVPLVHRSAGYLLDIDPECVDLHRFRTLVREAAVAGRPAEQRAALLRQGLELWRGEPLTGLSGQWADRTRHAWRGLRLDAAVLWARAEVEAGNPAPVIGPLTELLAEHPLVEPLSETLIRALHAAGRDAEALEHFARIRQRLIDELGTEPGPALREAHQVALSAQPIAPPAGGPVARGVPAQLPLDVPAFVGRTAELARLDAALVEAGEQPTAVVVVALLGTAGAGKTTLAVHWAHTVAERFPDGQLYVNLRGFDPAGAAMSPGEAIRGFLDALGVPMARVPAGLSEQAALYRSVLAGRRMLVLLDNARDAEQVRPLLPGAPGCLVVVTSRDRLTSLVAAEGAQPVPVDLLSMGDARALLARRLGAGRIRSQPAAVDDIVRRCARLPLALALVAARAATHPEFELTALATELRGARGGLDVLTGGDAATDVRAVFSWSYAALTPSAAEVFRLLGLHPGPDVSAAAAASVAALPVDRVRPALAELARAHLLAEPAPGRFVMHDLLRAYAAELARKRDAEPARTASTDRVLDHYLHTAFAAARLLQPHRDPITLDGPSPGTTTEELGDHEHALAWFAAEHQTVLAAMRLSAATGRDRVAVGLAWSLETFLHRRGHAEDLVVTQTVALTVSGRMGDRAGQAGAHRGLARAYAGLGRFGDAYAHFARALELFDELGNRTGRARSHLDFAHVLESQGAHTEALDHALRALPIYREAGHRAGEAYALNAIGWYHAQLGDPLLATRFCEEALALHAELSDRYGEAAALDSLGYAYHHLGRHPQAADCLERSLTMVRSLGDRYYEAMVLTHLGDARHSAGDPRAAERSWRSALVILEDLDHPDANRVRANLRRSRSPVPPS